LLFLTKPPRDSFQRILVWFKFLEDRNFRFYERQSLVFACQHRSFCWLKGAKIKQKQGSDVHKNENYRLPKTWIRPKFFENCLLEAWSKKANWFSNIAHLLHGPQRRYFLMAKFQVFNKRRVLSRVSGWILAIKKQPLCGPWRRWAIFENEFAFFDQASKVSFSKNFGLIQVFGRR
jgi:hypothetical protein